MKTGIPVYEGVALVDVAGLYEMFKWVDAGKRRETVILSADGGAVTTVNGLQFQAQASFAAPPALDIL